MISRIAFSLLALATFSATAQPSNATISAPQFELPYACAYTFTGTTTRDAKPSLAIEFERNSVVSDSVLVSAPGIVRSVRDLGYGSIGRYIVVDHGDGWTTTYSNLARVDVKVHERVEAGQRLGIIGRLGDEQTTYLHYMQSKDGFPVSARFNGIPARYFGEAKYTSVNDCGNAGPVPGVARVGEPGDIGFVWVRNGAWPRAQIVGELFNGSRITVQCQLVGGNYLSGPDDRPSSKGSELWYRIAYNGEHGYLPAPQVQIARGQNAEICVDELPR